MNPVAVLNTQFVQVALPLMLTLSIAAWWNNKRVDDLRGDMKDLKGDMKDLKGDMNRRFDRIEALLSDHGERIVKLEERTSPLTRR
jgi:hypothetical protein